MNHQTLTLNLTNSRGWVNFRGINQRCLSLSAGASPGRGHACARCSSPLCRADIQCKRWPPTTAALASPLSRTDESIFRFPLSLAHHHLCLSVHLSCRYFTALVLSIIIGQASLGSVVFWYKPTLSLWLPFLNTNQRSLCGGPLWTLGQWSCTGVQVGGVLELCVSKCETHVIHVTSGVIHEIHSVAVFRCQVM